MLCPLPDPRSSSPAAEAGCREWYETHGAAVYGYLRFHLSSADEAEDVTADVFLRAVRAADRFDSARGSARTWLLRIARNALNDHRRRERHRRHVPIGALYDLRSDAPSPEERLLWEETVGRLLAAVSALGVREAVVRTRLWRALGRLRRMMASAT